ncbi:hypothetical protein K470DRAFT_261096 [Piedraia hortae CBS 480.64]|uniref:Uncharacterized protein n=1 Tax=Piedraia hortae CBS 480.64 TaxID=1314780 RepID=A0A6A7BPL1_9PEZI|nr:hypothetical protein K470DRAFT_261096 [Piedraia hortae CBS 480.64]
MDLTPIYIRGKRRSKRKDNQPDHLPPSLRSHKRHQPHRIPPAQQKTNPPSRLELLPTEVIQSIFLLSKNISLPLTSPTLKDQLTSPYMFTRFMDVTMRPLTGNILPSQAEVADARSVLNARFVTFGFFVGWVSQFLGSGAGGCIAVAVAGTGGPTTGPTTSTAVSEAGPTSSPAPGGSEGGAAAAQLITTPLMSVFPRLPPSKLLHGPWCESKISFLRLFSPSPNGAAVSSPDYPLARRGLFDAIVAGEFEAFTLLLRLGVSADLEVLRAVVMGESCGGEFVRVVLERVSEGWGEVDVLDQKLWEWVEEAERRGEGKAGVVRGLLQGA